MSKSIDWKTAWVTGASTGIGRETALMLARAGVQVAISARSREALHALADLHENLHAFELDVTDTDAVSQTHKLISEKLGHIDLAILNAGVWHPMSAGGYDLGQVRTSMEVNYFGVCNALDVLIPVMASRGQGHIAMTASVAGYRGLPQAVAYGPSKSAVITLAEVLKPDLGRHGVKVSVINPGFVDTPMTEVNDFPMPFIITPEKAAEHIVKGLKRGKFEIAFPWQLVLALKMARIMPYWMFFWYVRIFIAPSQAD